MAQAELTLYSDRFQSGFRILVREISVASVKPDGYLEQQNEFVVLDIELFAPGCLVRMEAFTVGPDSLEEFDKIASHVGHNQGDVEWALRGLGIHECVVKLRQQEDGYVLLQCALVHGESRAKYALPLSVRVEDLHLFATRLAGLGRR